ncbi:1-acyl-sn-glycerol-3-phosphate acyltransferase [uncultured Paraglaciecola sp.]|mgnify:CR=1 FL=1|uniref:1-acyl-sn-glycerol-3-phosphate acyltransferase n=1 Tax=uncultured Paraglaciecola sp. TaxID=1765024 RepID=UPI00261536F5|nr:1-acyl-sn-glycerol-3-phosphate acyltransferase [uncultured Paraglaciecola sp.]
MPERLNTPILCKQVPRFGNKFSYWLGTSVLRMLGWRYSGAFPCCPKMILAIAPHTSNWDFVIGVGVAFNLRLKISFFGKHSIFIPPFDRLLRHFGGIPIERSSKHGVVDNMAKSMRDADSMILCLAPEGTRSPISPWKTGFLHIAHKANVPVFLVAFDYKKKLIEFGPMHNISDNTQHELNRIYRHFENVPGKYPDKMITKVIPPVEKEIEQ